MISFNCTLLFNLPWTNAFKSRTGGILLKSCLVPDQVFLIAVPCSLALSYLTTCVIPFIRYVKHATQHLDLERHKEHTDCVSFLQVPSSKDCDKLTFLVLGEQQSRKESCLKVRSNWKRRWPNRYTLLFLKRRMLNRS